MDIRKSIDDCWRPLRDAAKGIADLEIRLDYKVKSETSGGGKEVLGIEMKDCWSIKVDFFCSALAVLRDRSVL